MYRKRDLLDLERRLCREGNYVNMDFTLGETPFDNFVDKAPYKMNPHLKLRIGARINPLVTTSYGIIIIKNVKDNTHNISINHLCHENTMVVIN